MAYWLSHFVNPYNLDPGDHIYVYTATYFRPRHGIYIGEYKNEPAVIHYKRDESGKQCKGVLMRSSLSEFRENAMGGIALVRKYRYNISGLERIIKRTGTCSSSQTDPVESVLRRAWDCYNGKLPNCGFATDEEFALYCKLGEDFRNK
ncbi:uncharacterized protein LOC144438654 [Glandiceps talaboti]